MDRARNQSSVAARVAHPLQVSPGENATSRQKPDSGMPPSQGLQQSQIHSAPGSNPAQIKHKKRFSSGGCGLLGQAQRIGAGTAGILHGWVNNRSPEPEVEAEHQT